MIIPKRIFFTIYSIISVLMIFAMLSPSLKSYADSMDNSVATEDEFFIALGRQRLSHKSNELYYISGEDLKNQITVNRDIYEPFMYHYNPNDPLASGCYTYLSVHDMKMSWFQNKSRTLNVEMHFFVPKDTMDAYYEEMKQLSAELKGENDYESVKAVHDYIIRRVEYDYSSTGENYTDIEGFRENRMVCQGYSMASYVLLSDMGIPVRIVIGDAGDEKNPQPHAWNVVQVDGKWYNYDATWDDAGGDNVDYTYFLKSSEDFPMHYPRGLYSKSEFTDMISDTSYEMPSKLKKNIYLMIPAMIPWFIAIYIFYRIKRTVAYNNSYINPHNPVSDTSVTDDTYTSSAAGTNDIYTSSTATIGTVIEDDFDSFINDNSDH